MSGKVIPTSSENNDASPESKSLLSTSSENETSSQEETEPWPATFQRSISLLSTPVMNARKIEIVTKSPEPGNTPILGGLQVRLMHLKKKTKR